MFETPCLGATEHITADQKQSKINQYANVPATKETSFETSQPVLNADWCDSALYYTGNGPIVYSADFSLTSPDGGSSRFLTYLSNQVSISCTTCSLVSCAL